MVQFEYEPHGLRERIGGLVGADKRRVRDDLERLKALIERRGRESGPWRGEIDRGVATGSADEATTVLDPEPPRAT